MTGPEVAAIREWWPPPPSGSLRIYETPNKDIVMVDIDEGILYVAMVAE